MISAKMQTDLQLKRGDGGTAGIKSMTQKENRDKIDGLEADLEDAVHTCYRHGAVDYVKLNYPEIFKKLETSKED